MDIALDSSSSAHKCSWHSTVHDNYQQVVKTHTYSHMCPSTSQPPVILHSCKVCTGLVGSNISLLLHSWLTLPLGWLSRIRISFDPRIWEFLPRCIECRRDLAMRILSVRLSVRLSVSLCQTRELWLNGREISADFLYRTKEHLS